LRVVDGRRFAAMRLPWDSSPGFWPGGNSTCAENIIAFTLDLLGNLPKHIRLRVVRADSGFCVGRWLELLESQRLAYIVVARL
jgi:hypothetical protein